MPQVIWTPKTTLQNKYVIQSTLAGGGFGRTYLAKNTTLDRLVVIKTLNETQQDKPNFEDIQNKFIQEAEILAQLQHPHIVQIYDMFQENGLEAIVMEYITGENLEVYADEYHGYIPESEGLQYINQIGQALEYVHRNGLLHRDVKPNNILLREDTQQAILIDFGLAREFQPASTKSMTGMYTEGYAPIEQYESAKRQLITRIDVANLKPGHYTDVYALGATLYYLLTKRPPLPSYTLADSGYPLTPPQQFNNRISARLNAAILQAMEILPQNRPQSIGELLGLLNQPVVNIPRNSQTIGKTPPVEIPIPIEIPKLEIPIPVKPKFQSFTEIIESKDKGILSIFTDSKQVPLEMIAILGGTFLMGSPADDKEAWDSEKPQHQVTVPS
ncbi:MAG: protein kinase domain-containing protein, partial [Dolichospermum sp.]